MVRRLLPITLLTAMLCALSAQPAFAQSFPSQTVRIVVPYPAGGSTDVLARSLARELSATWGQPVLVENIAGADSTIGASRVANASPDGHTLLVTIDPTVIGNRFLFKKLPYDPDKSLAPITMLARSGSFVFVHPSVPANNLRDLVEMARRSPGKIAYGSVGRGTPAHLVLETMGKREGVSFLHVPYKGVAPLITAVVAGEVSVSVASPAATGAMVRAGKVKAIAITSPTRAGLFPNVPSTADSGYPYVISWIWFGLFAPGGTSAQLVERINRDATAILKRPEFTAKYITAFSLDLVASTPAEFAEAIRADVANIGEMVKAAGVQPE
ncbi:MAG: tripartite tricarboxylate transporter substrate binding protein [Betaproteobacteria bacterium]|nr:tripartite tricarboxylate transporter substrate binding protein [Betaproteobacteria bacterium]MBI2960972.1 tripartite tricarboxylate transporter substrate binding protein [Betaproteobacteria bacterium]